MNPIAAIVHSFAHIFAFFPVILLIAFGALIYRGIRNSFSTGGRI